MSKIKRNIPGVVPDPEAISNPQSWRAGRRHEELSRRGPPHVCRVGRVELGHLLPLLRLAPDLHVTAEVAEAAQEQEVALKKFRGGGMSEGNQAAGKT